LGYVTGVHGSSVKIMLYFVFGRYILGRRYVTITKESHINKALLGFTSLYKRFLRGIMMKK
jgi:hypothetical protein